MKYFPIAAISFMAAVLVICIWLVFSQNNSLTCELAAGWKQYFTEDALRQIEETDFGQLGEGWAAAEEYDCYYIDKIAFSGYVGFQYEFYGHSCLWDRCAIGTCRTWEKFYVRKLRREYV